MAELDPLQAILDRSRHLFSAENIDTAISRMAAQISADLEQQELLVLSVMNGALPVVAALIQKLNFAIQMDYIHVSRYGDQTSGGDLQWHSLPRTKLAGKTVLVVDDIFDEGYTLQAIVDYCRTQQASKVKTAVLVDKQHARKVPGFAVDFIGLEVSDEYVFGFGMDCNGWGRNLPDIYALQESR